MDLDELLPLLGRYTVLILNPRVQRTAGELGGLRRIEMTAAWSGRTIAAMQVWDILRAVEWAVDRREAPSVRPFQFTAKVTWESSPCMRRSWTCGSSK